MFKVTLGLAVYHNHRLDAAFEGRYLVRLPNRSLVYAEDYAQRLAEYHQRQAATGAVVDFGPTEETE